MNNNKLFILAGDMHQACEYARRKGLKRDEYIYVSDESKLFGRRKCKMMLVGTYYVRRSLDKLLAVARAQEFEIIYDHY